MPAHWGNVVVVAVPLPDDVATSATGTKVDAEPLLSGRAATEKGDIVFFDGVCNLCNGVVQFIIDRDAGGGIRFAALQSEAAREILGALGVELRLDEPDSIVLVTDGGTAGAGERIAYERSSAVLRIARKLSFPWPLLFYTGILMPRFLRDVFYKFVAGHRYGWFGKAESCRVPTPELRARFLA